MTTSSSFTNPNPKNPKKKYQFVTMTIIAILFLIIGGIIYAYRDKLFHKTTFSIQQNTDDVLVKPHSPEAKEAFKQEAIEYLQENAPSKEEVNAAREILLEQSS